MDYLLKPALMILVFGLLVVFHEFGHYIVARWMGVKVLSFSVGFGPTLVAWVRGGTEYAIRWLPLGGFVRMLGDDPMSPMDPELANDPEAFQNRPVWRRSLIIAAGPIFNFILPLIVLFGSALVYKSDLISTRVGTVIPGGPAATAGLLPGDRILRVGGAPVTSFDDLVREVSKRAGQATEIVFERAGQEVTTTATPREVVNAAAAELGLVEHFGRILLYPGEQQPTVTVRPDSPAWQAGIRPGDRLLRINDREVKTISALSAALAASTGPSVSVTWAPLAIGPPVERPRWRETFRRAHDGAPQSAQVQVPAGARDASALGLSAGNRLVGPVLRGSTEDEQMGLSGGDEVLSLDGSDLESLEDLLDRLKRPYEAVLTGPDYRTSSPEQRVEALRKAAGERTLVIRHVFGPAELPAIQAVANGTHKPDGPMQGWLETQPNAMDWVRRGFVDRPISWRVPVRLNGDDHPEIALDMAGLMDHEPPEMVPNPEPLRHALQVTGEEFTRGATVILVTVGELFKGNVPVKEFGGIIRMAQLTSQAADHGAEEVLRLIAWLSINLAILNLLPIPLVDGGHLLFLAIEGVRRRPASLRTRQVAAYVGLTFLGILFLVVMKNDVQRLLVR